MHNISPARAMARQARRYLITGAVILLAGLVMIALDVFTIVIPLTRAGWYGTVQIVLLAAGLVALLVGGVFVFRSIRFPAENHHARRMGEVLARALDYRYTYIHSINRRKLGYVDAVLLGPHGALVFYFFDRPGRYLNEGNLWYQQEGHELRLSSRNPTREAVRDVTVLRKYFLENDLAHMPVYAVVVVTRQETIVTTQQPVMPVAYMPGVMDALQDNYLAQERVDPQSVAAGVRAIMRD